MSYFVVFDVLIMYYNSMLYRILQSDAIIAGCLCGIFLMVIYYIPIHYTY